MKEYRIQKKDPKWSWEFENPDYISYTTKEMAQKRIDEQIRSWECQKNSKNPGYPMYVIERFASPENWRIVEREVSEWKTAD